MSGTSLHSQDAPPLADIRNALQLLAHASYFEGELPESQREMILGMHDAIRLLRHAIQGLSEPNLAAMQAGAILLKEWDGTPDERQQPPLEDILNALQIITVAKSQRAFRRACYLLRSAVSKMGEPHPHTVELTRRYLEAACGRSVDDREARDFAQVVINSALRWEAP